MQRTIALDNYRNGKAEKPHLGLSVPIEAGQKSGSTIPKRSMELGDGRY
jgi:hypothetical protein